MKRNGRIYRTLKAAKNAFFDKPNDVKKPQKNAPVQKREETDVLLTAQAATVMDLKPQYCIGCSACFNSCPTNAISIEKDDWGFYTRNIDFDKCVNCGKCVKACPVISVKHENNPDPGCYAVMADDETRKDSSSGGAFSIIAEYVLKQGGYVCGAALNEDLIVEHIIIESKDELYRLRGSKYVQSRVGDVFTRIKELLTQDRLVLFTGTPCQVAGLKNYLEKDYDNLIAVDLICHGSPSIKVFHKYLDEYYGMENLKDFRFRTKEFGYNSFNQTAYLKDGSTKSGNITFDAFEKTMHSGVALKDICGDCMFAPVPRQGDITIGDFWGISKHKPEYNDGLGTSCVLVNNQKGEQLFAKLSDNMKLCKPMSLDVPVRNNRLGRKMNIPAGRRWFYNMLDAQPLDKVVDYALNRKFDIGVIGLWYGRNYGSMATYYALHYVLTGMGLSVLMIENCLKPKGEAVTKTHPIKVFSEFYDISAQYPLDDLKKLNQHCDTFIVGSDQLWNVHLSRPYRLTYYLGFVDELKKKIAYGTSFGIPYCGSEEERMISKHNLLRFDHISVRDRLSEDTCRDLFQIEATQVCDPTFLCSLDGYETLVKKAKLKKEENYILAYILDPNEETGKALEELSQSKQCKVVVIIDETPKSRERNKNAFAFTGEANVEIMNDVDVCEWLWYYKNADSVVTDSFHGTIFSIIYKKPFVTVVNQRRGAERFVSLLTPLGLIDRLYDNIDEAMGNSEKLNALDYTEPYKALDEIRERSLGWLKNAIYSPKKVKTSSVYNLIDVDMENQNNE